MTPSRFSARAPRRQAQLLLGAALLPLASAAFAAAPQHDPKPDPKLDPMQVVRIQLEALAQNDKPAPDSGTAVAYAFASPENRRHIGPLPQFSAMIHKTFAPLLNHRSAHLNPIIMQSGYALERVELVARNGHTARFIFVLSRQSEPPYADCWMTDGVLIPPGGADQQDGDGQQM